MGKRLSLTKDDARNMQALYDSGMTIKAIAERYGISATAVMNRIEPREEMRSPKTSVPPDFARRWDEARFKVLERLEREKQNGSNEVSGISNANQ